MEYERVYGTITPVSQSPLKLRGLQNTPGKGGPGQSPSLKRRAVSPAIMDPRSASKTFTHSSLRSPNVTRKVIPATSAQKPPGLPSGLAKVAGTNAMTPRARPMPQQAYPPVTPASVYDGEWKISKKGEKKRVQTLYNKIPINSHSKPSNCVQMSFSRTYDGYDRKLCGFRTEFVGQRLWNAKFVLKPRATAVFIPNWIANSLV